MITVPDAFRNYKQFFMWVEKPNPGKPKPKKVPIDPNTGRNTDPMSPNNWITADEALAIHEIMGYGVGFTFTKEDPFFFLDIDDCLVDNQWSETATILCNTFSGAYVEISQSGTGLHIFGSGDYPEHSCRNTQSHIEFYTEQRFVALTGTSAAGDALCRPQPAIDWLISNYFNPGVNSTETAAQWTDGPCSDWHGIEDDQALIEKMLACKSTAGVFGGATVADLWSGDMSYYSDDHSVADAALCQHLAFWTGRDCTRIDRLFRLSGLMRDKWDEQRGKYPYGVKTILGAVGGCVRVYGERDKTIIGVEEMREGLQYMSVDQQIDYFRGCTYIINMHRIVTPKGQFLKPDQFKVAYGGWLFALDNINGKSSDCPYKAFTQNQGYNFPKVDTICFRPELPELSIFEQHGLTMLNTWLRIETDRKSGDMTPFTDHFAKMLPDEHDREILLSWMASVVQNPGKKIPWVPIIQGCQGNGKSMLMKIMENAVGERYCHRLNAADLAKNGLSFNAWILNKLFVGIEEIYVPKRREVLESLKTYVTDNRIEIQAKGVDQVTGDNRVNFMACTNHKDGVPIARGDRRYCLFFTAQQSEQDMIDHGWKTPDGNSTKYFSRLYDWLNSGGYAIITDYLFNYQVSDELNPFTTATTAPKTSSTELAIKYGMGGMEQSILEAIKEGRRGFIHPWVSSFALNELIGDKLPQTKRTDVMESLGYVLHPNLTDGRSTRVIPTEGGGKPRLYVLKGHPVCEMTVKTSIIDHYVKTQANVEALFSDKTNQQM